MWYTSRFTVPGSANSNCMYPFPSVRNFLYYPTQNCECAQSWTRSYGAKLIRSQYCLTVSAKKKKKEQARSHAKKMRQQHCETSIKVCTTERHRGGGGRSMLGGESWKKKFRRCDSSTAGGKWEQQHKSELDGEEWSLFHGFSSIRTAVAPSLSLDQRHGNWLFSSYIEDVSFWSVLGTLSALEAFFAKMRYIN